MVVVAIFGAVTIVTASSIGREITQYSQGKNAELQATANMFAHAISKNVESGDHQETAEALVPIRLNPSIEYVTVHLANGEQLAEIGRPPSANDDTLAAPFADILALFPAIFTQSLSVTAPIIQDDNTIGALTVYAYGGELYGTIGVLIYDALVAAVFAAGIGLLIALKMQRSITDPIVDLVKVMTDVRENGDFSRRAKLKDYDETGELVISFNNMLDQLQERDFKLKNQKRNLQKIVEHRTRQLQSAKEAAETASVAKSDFLATMSHEIRTPMNGMMVMADMLSKGNLPPHQKRYADVIAQSGKSLLAIVNDILDFSKIEAKRLELEKIPVRPAVIVDDIVSLFWENATSKGLDLAGYVSPSVPDVIEGDPVRINQVLSNLVNNALKFTEKGQITVAVRRLTGTKGNCVIEFSVTDSGVGINDEVQSKIFDAFSQADQTTTRKFGGTGLGLAICRRLVEAMGGKINVTSRHGTGSKFFFSFPTQLIAEAKPPRRASKQLRAIVAIDGAATSKMLVRHLQESAISAQTVGRFAEAREKFSYTDLIFASPKFLNAMAGTIKDNANIWTPKRICISELGDTEPDSLLETGIADDLLISPLSRRDVLQQVERILDDKLRGKSALNVVEPEITATAEFNGERVLAADDSAVNREVVKEALGKLNLKATLAADGREAVALYQKQKFDLVLMDCSMPNMDGFEATRAIRKIEQSSNASEVPVIALTAHVSGKENAWRDAGMNDYLAKPFSIDALSKTISTYIPYTNQPADKRPPSVPRECDVQSITAQSSQNHEAQPKTSTATNQANSSSAFDQTVLNSLVEMQSGNDNLPVRVLTLFKDHSRDAILRLAKSVKTQDPKEIASAAHALKSMSLNVGAKTLAEACVTVENFPFEPAKTTELVKLIKNTHREYQRATAELPKLINQYTKNVA